MLLRLLAQACGDDEVGDLTDERQEVIVRTIESLMTTMGSAFRDKISQLQRMVDMDVIVGNATEVQFNDLVGMLRNMRTISKFLLGMYCRGGRNHGLVSVIPYGHTAFASPEFLNIAHQEVIMMVYACFIRDLIESIFATGQLLNDIRILESGQHASVETQRTTCTQHPDLREPLCRLIKEICEDEQILIPPTMHMLASKCSMVTNIIRRIVPRIPVVFTEDRSSVKGREDVDESIPWLSALAQQDSDYAAASALNSSYFYLYALEGLLDVMSVQNAEADLPSGSFLTESLARNCYQLLEDSIIRTPPEYASYAFGLCVRLQQIFGSSTFCVEEYALEVLERCLEAGNLPSARFQQCSQ
ncbi:hypothetical protein BC832DRAFT_83815 [Gaertneriomyces semiglobifer]|nr:hypothetical protein BC832DRAFT_83815 [Gaertneriomyces semiglobifer]